MSQLTVLSPGVMSTIQDVGRRGWRRAGVPWSGALDGALLALANALVGNALDAPAIECLDGGLKLGATDGPVMVSIAGDASIDRIDQGGAVSSMAPWRSHVLAPGEQLRVRDTGDRRVCMIGVAGLSLAPVLGSCATYARARLGGFDGRALAAGDRLPAADAAGPIRLLPSPPTVSNAPIRVVPGPQSDHFTGAARERFVSQTWQVSPEADRMGLRLAGEALTHVDADHREIVSDAIVPGAIQVPGNGLPIVLLADSQTAGGYPKIGTVISADLGRMGTLKPGTQVHFEWIGVDAAIEAARMAAAQRATLISGIRSVRDDSGVDLDALYGNNLLSGMVNALNPDTGDKSDA
ncbi:5-oxoprolinase subunit C family protein [Nitrogeniibacter aestuarii]|uniref:5-oxoprolinase subunit C family protein n=1 Tax=Nitrogeniibacter aestuarii TaxID=2815343 RepID=UPI001D10F6DA|nr:biotin-dependent carboxyltransferase family protein [Nitrogeniibacter aestuarii]